LGAAPRWLQLVAAVWLASAFSVAHAAESCGPAFDNVSSGGAGTFLMYEALFYRGMPDLAQYGIKKIRIIDRGIWSAAGDRAPPDQQLVGKTVKSFPPNDTPVVLDFERYPLIGDGETVGESIAILDRIIAAFRPWVPGRQFGYYGVIPLGDYWRALPQNRNDPQFRAWQADNDRLAPLERDADVLFPSLYTYYEDRNGWRRFAISQICEARRISKKPVIPFLWPEYHNSNTTVRDRFIAADYWRMQLEVVRRYADGVVVWGGYDVRADHAREWDDSARWWQQTKEFAEALGNSR